MTERTHILQAQFFLRSLPLPGDALLAYLLPHIRLSTNKRLLKKIRLQYLQGNLEQRRTACSSNLLSLCRPTISSDPILWLPMTRLERSRCIRCYNTTCCFRHTSQLSTKQHTIYCLDMRHRLQIPKSFWTIRWHVICAILHELDHLYHEKEPPSPSDPGQKLHKWLFNSS
ncbi:hypothetical protein BCV72DRAFT_249297 [Rhizopus microsporus var. microsporus]|uniref:Uncharacterized protein n=1 Tax=Rhizopus microsporus var. microsporus TaxID=86635 RepID=A0A1X0R6N6_RHIZD|nr:hypothetical protein BCV72DRAFT_249297 [Rhizopus microsporus var. microsporus]